MPEKSEPEHDLPCDVSHSKPDSCAPVKAPSFGERTRRNFAGTRSDLNGKERHLSSHKVAPRPVFAPAWMKKTAFRQRKPHGPHPAGTPVFPYVPQPSRFVTTAAAARRRAAALITSRTTTAATGAAAPPAAAQPAHRIDHGSHHTGRNNTDCNDILPHHVSFVFSSNTYPVRLIPQTGCPHGKPERLLSRPPAAYSLRRTTSSRFRPPCAAP